MTAGPSPPAALTREQLARFDAQGYLVLPGLLSQAHVEHYRELGATLIERARSLDADHPPFFLRANHDGELVPGELRMVQGFGVVEPRMLPLLFDPLILDKLITLLGPRVEAWSTKFFACSGDGKHRSSFWHWDNWYFGVFGDEPRVVSCVVELDEVDADNGCLRVVPRSHEPARVAEMLAAATDAGGYETWRRTVQFDDAVDIVGPPGTVTLLSGMVMHGARPNSSSRTRRSLAWHCGAYPMRFKFRSRSYVERHGPYADLYCLRGLDDKSAGTDDMSARRGEQLRTPSRRV